MKRRLLTIALAFMLGVLGLVAVLAYVHKANDRAIAGLKAVTVLEASSPINAGTNVYTALEAKSLVAVRVPQNSAPSSGYVSSITQKQRGLAVSAAMRPGQVLMGFMLVKPGQVTASIGGLALSLPPNDIAVTMEMCLDADVAGYVQPGSYVAVFATAATSGTLDYSCTSHQAPTKGRAITGVAVAKVKVLSIVPASSQGPSSAAQQAAADPANSSSSDATDVEVLVTLAATSQQQANVLILLANAGDPTFGLLGSGASTIPDPAIQSLTSP